MIEVANLIEVVALHRAGRLESCEGEGVHIFLERHAVLQAERDRDGEIVDDGAQRRAFLVHVDKNFAEPAVVIFAGAQIDLVAADHGLLGVALAPVRHALALADHGDALHHPLDDALGQGAGARRRGFFHERRDGVVGVLLVLVGDQLALQRLRQF